MRIEHIALNVAEPQAMAAWYLANLELRMALEVPGAGYMAFLADDNDQTVLELYHNPAAAVPDFASMSRYAFHIALVVDNIESEIDRLVAAGGRLDCPIENRDNGDRFGFVRDPWGVVLQLVERQTPLL